jgi:hypothetical protein
MAIDRLVHTVVSETLWSLAELKSFSLRKLIGIAAG